MRTHLNDYVVKHLPFAENGQHDVWDTSLPRFGLRVGKRTKTFIYNTGSRRITLGRYPLIGLQEARNNAKRRLAAKYLPHPIISIEEAKDTYLRTRATELKPSTQNAYAIYLRLLKKDPHEITAHYVYSILPKGKGAANLAFNVFKAFLTWCLERDYIQVHPLLKRRTPNKLKSRDRLLTDDETRKIWITCASRGNFGILVRMLILSGQRLNQIMSLQDTWIDTETDVIVFPAPVMKNSQEHTIPLSRCMKVQLDNTTNTPTIFPKAKRTVREHMRNLRADLGDMPHWTLHDFRRYFSSTCAKVGVPVDVTEAILAHKTGSRSNIQRVYDRYDRLDPMRSALERYGNYLQTVLKQNG